MNDEIKEKVHAYYNSKVPTSNCCRTIRSDVATLSSEEYEFLYEIIETNPYYTKKAELLRRTVKHYQDRKSCNSPLPLLLRQAIYLLAYELCNGDYYDVAQKKALDDVGLSHNLFTKWHMQPKNDFNAQLYLRLQDMEAPPAIPLRYQGKKNTALVYLASELAKQIEHRKFVDVFGGSGAVTVGISKNKNTEYFINDADSDMTDIYKTLRNHGKIFIKTFREIQNAINNIPEATDFSGICLSLFPEVKTSEMIEIGRALVLKSLEKDSPKYKDADEEYRLFLSEHPDAPVSENIYEPPLKPSIYSYQIYLHQNRIYKYGRRVNSLNEDLAHLEILYARGLYKHFSKIAKQVENYSAEQRAIASMFCRSFDSRARADLSNIITQKTLSDFRGNLEIWRRVIHEYTYYKVRIFTEFDTEVVRKKEINCSGTLLYMDSPYINTAGYNSSYGRKEFEALHHELSSFKGHWIFSCRVGINYRSSEDKIPENNDKFMSKYDDLQFLVNLYSDIAHSVAFIRNNDISDEDYFEQYGIKEVMFLNFSASAPNINILRKLAGKKIAGINKKSIYRVIPYEKFKSLAMAGITPENW